MDFVNECVKVLVKREPIKKTCL